MLLPFNIHFVMYHTCNHALQVSNLSLNFHPTIKYYSIINTANMSYPKIVTSSHNPDGLSILRTHPPLKAISPAVSVIYSTMYGSHVDFTNDRDIVDHE